MYLETEKGSEVLIKVTSHSCIFVKICSINFSDINISDFSGVATWCKDNDISLVVVGPEDPLANGIADTLKKEGM